MSSAVARLSSALLARKGDASPAGYRTHFAMPQYAPPASDNRPASGDGKAQQQKRYKMTLRLDHERHLKLRLASAHTGRSMQDILCGALDDYLHEVGGAAISGGCPCLEEQPVPSKGKDDVCKS